MHSRLHAGLAGRCGTSSHAEGLLSSAAGLPSHGTGALVACCGADAPLHCAMREGDGGGESLLPQLLLLLLITHTACGGVPGSLPGAEV